MPTEIPEELNLLSEKTIGAAFEVGNVLGVGFLEKVYERAMVYELRLRGVPVEAQHQLDVQYKGETVGEFTADLLVDDRLIVELKCCDGFAPEHIAQCLNYLRASRLRLALLINFQKPHVEIKRVSL